MRSRFGAVSTLLLVCACAATISTGTLPVEALVVLDGASESLTVISVDSLDRRFSISLKEIPDFTPRAVAARGGIAVVAGDDNTIVVVDLVSGTIPLIRRNIPSAAIALTESGQALAGAPQSEVFTRVDVGSGQQATGVIRGGVGGFGIARGQTYATVPNRLNCGVEPNTSCNSSLPSWVSELRDGVVVDSIPISGPGNAGEAVGAPDGLLYVLSRGDGNAEEGRLSVIDPVGKTEIASYGGVGPEPRLIASDGGSRILIASNAGGMMVFDISERRMIRGFGSGIPIASPADMVVDALGRIYVVQLGGCTEGNPGRVKLFGQDLVERLPVELPCPIGAAIGEVPADLFAALPVVP